MLRRAPPAGTAVVCFLGDTMEYDGLLPVTAESGHVLNVDGRFAEMVRATYRVQRHVIDRALETHDRVVFVDAEGNHDRAATIQRREMWKTVYERESRFQVIESDLPFYAYEFGRVGLFWHHQDKVDGVRLVLTFADEFPEMWGRTRYRFGHVGHLHPRRDAEERGMDIRQHPTLAGRSAYEARNGMRSMRRARVYTYHRDLGEFGYWNVSPEMLDPMTYGAAA